MKINLLHLIFLFIANSSVAQSIHEEQLNEYNATGYAEAEYYESKPFVQVPIDKVNCNLEKIVYG